MLSSVCQRFDFTAPQLSLPLLFQNNETLNSSPVDHTSSLPAHSRSCRRSAPPAFHSPLQFNRLDFHLIPAEKTLTHFFTVNLTQVSLSFLLGSHSNSDFSRFRFLFFPFFYLQQQQNSPSLFQLRISFLFYFFPPHFPPDSSCCQLSFSTLCNMNSPGFFTS